MELTEECRKLLAELFALLGESGASAALPRVIEECLRLGLEHVELLASRLRRECVE